MQLTVSKETLMLALNRAQGIVGKKSTMPILSNILLETISTDRFTVTATDLDIFAKGEYEGLVDKAGQICVNAKDLYDITRNLPAGNIRIETVSKSNVQVTSGKITFKILSTNVEDYPSMPDFGEVNYLPMDAKVIHDLIDHTLFSVATDDPRIFLNGVNFEKLEDNKARMVSTDGHRLSLIDREVEADFDLEKPVIIPRKGLIELRKMLEESKEGFELAFNPSNGFFKRDDLLLVMRLIEGDFPDYNMVIPKSSEKAATMDKKAFQDALKRMSILSADRSFGVRFIFQPGKLTIESSDPEKGEGREILDIAYDGDEMQIGFNARYFLDSTNVLVGETIILELSDELSPCVVKEQEDENFLCVVMPVRIN